MIPRERARGPVRHPSLSREWMAIECGGGGDCLFHSIGTALGVTMQEVRRMVAQTIDERNVKPLLKYYSEAYRVGSWSRKSVAVAPNPVKALREVVQTPGPLYEGDDTTLRLLSSSPELGLAFVVLSAMQARVHAQLFLNRCSRRLIVLYHLPGHWQLAGWWPHDQAEFLVTVHHPFAPPRSLREALSQDATVRG